MPSLPLYSEALTTPSGWFCLGMTRDLPKGRVVARRLGGREIVVFRTASGGLAALDAHCPHLGAHMGRGGRVEGETIRCPFHGFCFDASGTCTKTAYGAKPPPTARARAYPVIVRDDVVLAYLHPRGLEPTWQPECETMDGWPPWRVHTWTLRGHPQETTENSVDIGHFGVVHGYTDLCERAATTTTGPHLFARYAFSRPALRLAGRGWSVRESIDVHVWGLGYSRVDVTDLSLGLDIRLLVMPTPIDAEHIELRIGISLRDFRDSPRVPRALRWVPRVVTSGLFGRGLLRVYRSEVEQDFAIWQHKRYIDPPALASGDGPVGLYRRWVKQFYEDPC